MRFFGESTFKLNVEFFMWVDGTQGAGEVFLLDIGLLMGAVCPSFYCILNTTISRVRDQRKKPLRVVSERLY